PAQGWAEQRHLVRDDPPAALVTAHAHIIPDVKIAEAGSPARGERPAGFVKCLNRTEAAAGAEAKRLPVRVQACDRPDGIDEPIVLGAVVAVSVLADSVSAGSLSGVVETGDEDEGRP